MKNRKSQKDLTVKQALVLIALSVVGLYFTGHFDPVPDRIEDAETAFLYYGPEGETVWTDGITSQNRARAEAALAETHYFAAFAVGPEGRTGIWTGARTVELARGFALAACGSGCRVVAERLPLHRDPGRTEPVATTTMAQNLALKWPFLDDFVALGGAGAWGHRTDPAGQHTERRAKREAAADCEARRAAEAAPDPALSPECRVQRITEFIDLRPKPTLYPAAYTVSLTALYPVENTRLSEIPDAPKDGWLGSYKPPRLYGARAATGQASFDGVREGGWPEAGDAIALMKCNAQRRPSEGPCKLTHRRVPADNVPKGALAVTPDLYASFIAWEETGGAGAFAISPYGAWGSSYDFADRDAAIQKAADWCWYYTRRNWEYRQVDKGFLDVGIPCRIVAVRDR